MTKKEYFYKQIEYRLSTDLFSIYLVNLVESCRTEKQLMEIFEKFLIDLIATTELRNKYREKIKQYKY